MRHLKSPVQVIMTFMCVCVCVCVNVERERLAMGWSGSCPPAMVLKSASMNEEVILFSARIRNWSKY